MLLSALLLLAHCIYLLVHIGLDQTQTSFTVLSIGFQGSLGLLLAHQERFVSAASASGVSRRTTSEEVVGDTGSNLVTGREPFFFPEASGSDFLADGLSAKIKEPMVTGESSLVMLR